MEGPKLYLSSRSQIHLLMKSILNYILFVFLVKGEECNSLNVCTLGNFAPAQQNLYGFNL